jgi:hypothetical protein
MPHKFKIGQRVHLSASGLNRHIAGTYRIVARLPEERGDPQYRVENGAGTQQRVVWESDLKGIDAI